MEIIERYKGKSKSFAGIYRKNDDDHCGYDDVPEEERYQYNNTN